MEKTAGILILLALVALAGCSVETGGGKEDVLSAAGIDAKKRLDDFVMVDTEGPKKKWKLKAQSAVVKEASNGDRILIDNFNVDFFNDTGGVKAQLESGSGEYDRATKILYTFGEVVLKTEDRSIETSNVRWDPDREIFVTDEFVTIITGDAIIEGVGMEASVDLEDIVLMKKIQGEVEKVE